MPGDALLGIRDEGFVQVGLDDLEIADYIEKMQIYCLNCGF